jgi:hypothetical protein
VGLAGHIDAPESSQLCDRPAESRKLLVR